MQLYLQSQPFALFLERAYRRYRRSLKVRIIPMSKYFYDLLDPIY